VKAPPENTSPEAIALREAALEWGQYLHDDPLDDQDRAGQRRNRALLFAAIRYTARVVTGLPVGEIRKFTGHVESWVNFMRKNDSAFGRAIRHYTGERVRL